MVAAVTPVIAEYFSAKQPNEMLRGRGVFSACDVTLEKQGD